MNNLTSLKNRLNRDQKNQALDSAFLWLVDYYYKVLVVLAPPIASLVIYRSLFQDLPLQFLALGIFTLLLPFSWLFRARLSVNGKFYLVLSALLLTCLATLLYQGFFGVGIIVLIIVIFLLFQMYGRNIFGLIITTTLMLLFSVGYLHYSGWYGDMQDLSQPLASLGKSITTIGLLTIYLYGLKGFFERLDDQALSERLTHEMEKRTNSEMRQFIEKANAAILGTDTNGNINVWNEKTAELTGFNLDEVEAKQLEKYFVIDSDRHKLSRILDLACQGEESDNFELAMHRKSGGQVLFLMNATTRRNFSGTIVGSMMVGQDITEMREQEKAALNLKNLDAIGRLGGGIAHEFNNLLTVIQGNLTFIADEVEDQNQNVKELLADSIAATKSGARLSEELELFAKQHPKRFSVFNVNSLLERIGGLYQNEFGNGAKISLQLEDLDLTVNANSFLLEKSLINLIDNALDSTDRKGPVTIVSSLIHVTEKDASQLRLKEGSHVKLSVIDTGRKISGQIAEKLTEEFSSAEAINDSRGLGLSMISGFMSQANGSFSIQSQESVGTTVTLTLPAYVDV